MKSLLMLGVLLALPLSGSAQGVEKAHVLEEWLRSKSEDVYAPGRNDRAENLVDELRYRSLAEMDKAGLRQAKVKQPWSDSYWPIYAGSIANRYADTSFSASFEWDKNERALLAILGHGPLEQLSPAEKYDLLVGDTDFTLTKQMIAGGRPYFDRYKKVESWMGLCHGWAAASIMMDRPAHAITLTAVDGSRILFYPSDIKALATLLWSNGRFENRFIGGRCNDKGPDRDDLGRPIKTDCLDTNAGTWHLAVVNQIGHGQRPLVMDISYDYEVWNQPAFSYLYSFVDPETGRHIEKLEDAIYPITDKDRFRRVRAPNAVNLVKVAMSIDYVLEREAEPVLTDSPRRDALGNALYQYELELDAKGEIVGGEWLQAYHPDFLWVPAPKARALSQGDFELFRAGDRSEWRTGEAVPSAWSRAAKVSSGYSQPLARIVEEMVRIAK